MIKAFVMGLSIFFGILIAPSFAAEFSRRGLDQGDIVELRGQINEGDLERLKSLNTKAYQKRGPIIGIDLMSRGGHIQEANTIAQYVLMQKWIVSVSSHNICASACFLILAAGHKKLVHEDAYIGIHGASNTRGYQDQGSLAATTGMARSLKRLGVPEHLLGRLVITPPDRMAWLKADDLTPMKVEIILRDGPSANSALGKRR